MKTLKNGTHWLDTDGNVIHAHGGYMLKVEDTYYWYGEDRRGENFVSCYKSCDLLNWEYSGAVLTTESATAPLDFPTDLSLKNEGKKVNIERPKFMYNKETRQYVMWAHYENGLDYHCAAICIATCDTPDGNFTYRGSFNPFGEMSRDCTIYFENDKPYFISAGRDNADLHIYSIREDYLGVKALEKKLFIGQFREAPALFNYEGLTYMVTSQCTSWQPNQCGYSYAKSLLSDWAEISPVGDDTTYCSQPAFILPIEANGKKQFVYIGDRWGGTEWESKKDEDFDYFNSSYYFSLIEVSGTSYKIPPCDEFTIDKDGFKIIK